MPLLLLLLLLLLLALLVLLLLFLFLLLLLLLEKVDSTHLERLLKGTVASNYLQANTVSTSDVDVTQWGLDQDTGYCRMSKKAVGINREEQNVSS